MAMQRSTSWPVDNARWKRMMSLSEFDAQGNRVLIAPPGPCDVPNLFSDNNHGGSSGSFSCSDSLPDLLCGWCGDAACNGLLLKNCHTWFRLRDVLAIWTPR